MPTLTAGRVVSILWPTDGQITITPGSAGRVSLNARGRDGSQSIAPREIYNAETINVSAGDTVILEAINTDATYTSPVSGDGLPAAFTSRALTNADDGYTLVCASSQTATVNIGLASGFGCAFKGTISFAGTATVTDVRTAGAANPWCALVQTGADTYDAVGSKA